MRRLQCILASRRRQLRIQWLLIYSGLYETVRVRGDLILSTSFRLSVYEGGRLVSKPANLTEAVLRRVLLMASGFDEGRVNSICKMVEDRGRCEMGDFQLETRFVLEKILRS